MFHDALRHPVPRSERAAIVAVDRLISARGWYSWAGSREPPWCPQWERDQHDVVDLLIAALVDPAEIRQWASKIKVIQITDSRGATWGAADEGMTHVAAIKLAAGDLGIRQAWATVVGTMAPTEHDVVGLLQVKEPGPGHRQLVVR
ncbi:MAG: hypothetical protein ACRDJY_05395 [Thermoleophilaceae bacterium]